MRNRTRVIAGAAIIATLAAGSTVAAVASTTGGKPGATTTTTTVPVSGQCAPGSDLAALPGVSKARVRQVVAAEKPCGAKPEGAQPAASKSARSKPPAQLGQTAITAAVARELHVSTARVAAALQPMLAPGYAGPSSSAFAAEARSLGVSIQQLTVVLDQAKQSLRTGS
jgi:hypothetical protein